MKDSELIEYIQEYLDFYKMGITDITETKDRILRKIYEHETKEPTKTLSL